MLKQEYDGDLLTFPGRGCLSARPAPPANRRRLQCLSSTASATSRSRCSDLDASLAFYEKLGFPEMLRLAQRRGRALDRLPPGHRRASISSSFPAAPASACRRERPHRPRPSLPDLARPRRDRGGASQPAGIALSQPRKAGRGVDGNRGMWIEDPDGNRIEIMEMAPDCIQYRAVENLRAGKPPKALTLF